MARDYEQEHALVRHKLEMEEREAAAKAVEKADKANRESEGDFVKGLPAGVAASLAKGYAFLGDILLIDAKGEKRTQMEASVDSFVNSFKEDKSESFKSGMEAGDVMTWFSGPEDLIRAGAIATVVHPKLQTAVVEQIADMKATKQKIPVAIREAAERLGINVDKIRPARLGELNRNAHRASSAASETNPSAVRIDPETGNYVDDTGEAVVGSRREMDSLEAGVDRNEQSILAYTQTEGNPLEGVGSEPQPPSPAGKIWEQHGIFASADERVKINGKLRFLWRGNKFDPEVADAIFKRELSKRRSIAAKSDSAMAKGKPPRYVVYDADSKVTYEVTTSKNGEVVVQKNNQFKPFRPDSDTDNVRAEFTSVRVSADPKEGLADAKRLDALRGKRLPKNPEDYGADEIIYGDKDGMPIKEYLESKVKEATAPTDVTPVHSIWPKTTVDGETSLPLSRDVRKPPTNVRYSVYDQVENVEWSKLSPTQRRDFADNKFIELRDAILRGDDAGPIIDDEIIGDDIDIRKKLEESYSLVKVSKLKFLGSGIETNAYRVGDKVIKIDRHSSPGGSTRHWQLRVNNALTVDREVGDGTLRVVGFSKTPNDGTTPIFEQQYYKGRKTTDAELRAHMISRGFTPSSGAEWPNYSKDLGDGRVLTIWDVHDDNAITDANGVVHVIDGQAYIKTK